VGGDSGFPVDVSIDGICALHGFTFGELAGPARLAPGTYEVAISPASATESCSNAPILESDVQVEGGKSYLAVAYLTEDGTPTLGLFEVDLSRPDPSDVRVVVLHLAEAPALDVSLRRPTPYKNATVISGLSNGDVGMAVVNPGSWRVRVSPPGTIYPLYEKKVILRNRTVYFAIAVGSFEDGTFNIICKHIRPQPKLMANALVVHGIPGDDLGLDPALPVDVSVNGMCVLNGLEYGDIVGPATLMPGTYEVELRPADMVNPCTGDALLSGEFYLAAGENATIIAYLDADGNPVLGKFTNDLSVTWWKRARVILHHTAWAPAVDVSFRRSWWDEKIKLCVSDLENGDQVDVELLPGKWEAAISDAGMGMPIFETDAYLGEEAIYLVYPVGSLTNDTFDVLIKQMHKD